MNPELQYRAMLAVDIQGSGGRGNIPQLKIREILSGALAEAFDRSGIDLGACHRDDRGDGARILVPPATPKYRLICPLLDEFAALLRTANEQADPKTVVRVRAALHAGDVYLGHDGGVAGVSLEVLARLVDAARVRWALNVTPPTMPVAAIMSQHFYEETVPHGYPGIDAMAFRKVRVSEKEYLADAWLCMPGGELPHDDPGPGAEQEESQQPGAPGDSSSARSGDSIAAERAQRFYTQLNIADGPAPIFTVQDGNMNFYPPGQVPDSGSTR